MRPPIRHGILNMMVKEIDKHGSQDDENNLDRPEWIPSHIRKDWDPNPYAYQNEDELMPQGLLHAQLLIYLSQVLPSHLRKFGLAFWPDLFLFYRDTDQIKKRIAPDFMIADSDMEFDGDSWNLECMPVPKLVGEVTSPDSRKSDLKSKVDLYLKLGINRYLVFDGLDQKGEGTEMIRSRTWLKGLEQSPSADGFHEIPELHIKVKAEAADLMIYDLISAKPLLDSDKKESRISEQVKELAEKDQHIRELEEKLRQLEN